MNENHGGHWNEELSESIAYVRESLVSAHADPSTIGWETEEWFRRREQAREDLLELLAPESIEAEMQVREDVPRLIAHLARVLRGASAEAA